jgi:hypothetical protein
MAIRSKEVKQYISYEPVVSELNKWLDIIQDNWGGTVISVNPIKVNKIPGCSEDGFLIIYDDNKEKK